MIYICAACGFDVKEGDGHILGQLCPQIDPKTLRPYIADARPTKAPYPYPVPTPKSDAALELWDEFCSTLKLRLEAGKTTYGDSSFSKPLPTIVEEIRQEILDQCGWAFILYSRLSELEAHIKKAQ